MRGLGPALLSALCVVLLIGESAQAGFKGEIDVESGYAGNTRDSLDAALGERSRWDQSLMTRLMWSEDFSLGLSLDTAYLFYARYGRGVELLRTERSLDPFFPVDPDRVSLWHLNHALTDHDETYVEHRLDRLSVGYSSNHLVVRAGRQALTWGSGLVFHPMDLFNPFPPNATYTTYKLGIDMLYGQWLFDSGADVQGVVVPRRDRATGTVTGEQSAAGVKWHGFFGKDQSVGIDVLLAQNYREQVLGVGAGGPFGGASWNVEAVPVRLDGNALVWSYLANMQYAWVWDEKNVNGYVEYFHNGFGVSGRGRTLFGLPVSLGERLARGEFFSVSRDYLGTGIDVQWSPLLNLKPSVIVNLVDGSALLISQAVYSLSQDTGVTLGFQWGIGGHGTEYGGLETTEGSGVFAAPADTAYARFTWYF
jgi:hypothetical protein